MIVICDTSFVMRYIPIKLFGFVFNEHYNYIFEDYSVIHMTHTLNKGYFNDDFEITEPRFVLSQSFLERFLNILAVT